MPDVFLSYSRDDQATARKYAEAFERAGLSVWWDQTLNPGETFDEVTEKALEEARAVVVLWSKHSVTSRWVRGEATQADRSGKLVPVFIEPCKLPIQFELTQAADLAGWSGDGRDSRWQNLLAAVRNRAAATRPAANATPAAPREMPVRTASAFKPVWIAVAALVVLAVLAGAWLLTRERAGPATAATRVSLAVLPFADLSAARDQEYFSEGLSEEILNQLAAVPELRLIGRTSSFSFKGLNEDLREIGRKLGVDNLLEGSIRKDGDQLLISANLINAKDGSQSWSKSYNRQMSGLFVLQGEIATDVARALSVTLNVGESSRARGGTTNVEAYDKYLQAGDLVSQEGIAEFDRAIDLLKQAVALDAEFGRAWQSLGDALDRSAFLAEPDRRAPLVEASAQAHARAQALSPEAWWVKRPRIEELIRQREWREAEELARSLLDEGVLTAADIERASPYVNLLHITGRVQEGIRVQQQILQMDPLSLSASTQLQFALDATGKVEETREEYVRSLDLKGNHQRVYWLTYLRMVAEADPDPAAVREQYQKVLDTENLRMKLLQDLGEAGTDKQKARMALGAALNEPGNQDPLRLLVIAHASDAFGDRDLAIDAQGRIVKLRGTPQAIWNLWRSGVRADPRFKQQLRDVGLADYWRSTGNWGDFCKPVGTNDFECR